MRVPLLILIAAYAISVLGFVLIPGLDENGQRWNMSFLDAVYFVSYMATTIGFGELPYTFNAAQRIWTLVAIYLTVISWLYAIGAILTLVQNARLKRAVEEGHFKRSVARLREPFYIICGYGDTASQLVRSLGRRRVRTVVIDKDQDRIDDLKLEVLPFDVPALVADASEGEILEEAGLYLKQCQGVVALTDSDHVNLKIAITCRLLVPEILVICRAETTDTEANMKSFKTDYIINPFDRFAARLAMALHSPSMYIIHQWLAGIPGTSLADPAIPSHGKWVLCGYGRFGKAVHRFLTFEGDTTKIIEADHANTQPPEGSIKGRGTEAVTLRSAGIKEAVGIVAGTDNDTNNLSIIFTAKEQNDNLFMVARQNRRSNEALFREAGVDIVMERSDIIAHEILALILTPMMSEFLTEVRHHGNDWTCELASRLIAVVGDTIPETWAITINEKEAPAIAERIGPSRAVMARDLMVDHRNHLEMLQGMVLMIKRETEQFVLPKDEFELAVGDQILFCAREGVRKHVEWTLSNRNVLRYVQTGIYMPDGSVWRWLAQRREASQDTT
jgi:Trk K+ transport system NAD-binding subunit